MLRTVMGNVLHRSNFRYGYITLLIVLVLMLTLGSLPDTNLLWREVQNSGHTLLFVPVAIIILLLLREANDFFWQKPFKLYMASCFTSLLIGVVVELVQLITHGDVSEMDVVRDFAGIIVGLGLYAGIDPGLKMHKLMSGKRSKTVIVALSFCVFSVSMMPLAFLSVAYAQREIAFPVIVDLKANWIRPFLQLKNSVIKLSDSKEIVADDGDRLMRVDFKRGDYPGISIIEISPDWSAYKVLTIVVYSKLAQSFDLVLRIHDDQHNFEYSDRFNVNLTVDSGVNSFRVLLDDIQKSPASRQMDMRRMREITLFSASPAEDLYFFSGDMRLE